MKSWDVWDKLLILAIAWVVLGGKLPGLPDVVPLKVTAVTYVYEKDDSFVPSPVAAALDKLNRQGIIANTVDDDVIDGDGEVADQYKLAIPAARLSGLPTLVVTTDQTVTKVVKNPLTEEAVLEAVK